MTSWSRTRTAAIPARATPYSTAAVTARFTARGMLPSCRVPMAGSQRLQVPLKSTPGGQLTIGELACRAGVTASALRDYEELGLPPAPARTSGRPRYPESAARLVAAILLHSDAGFTLAEQKALMATRASTPRRPETAHAAQARGTRRADRQGAGRPRGHQARAALPPRGHHAMPQLQRRHHRPARRPATVTIPPAVARPTVPRGDR